MKIPTPRVLAATALLASCAGRAASAPDRDADAVRRERSRAEAWRADVASPENFSRFIEGAREHRGGVPDPEPLARAAPRGAPPPRLRPFLAPAPVHLDAPPLPSLRSPANAAVPARGSRFNFYATCVLAGGLACLLFALGGESPDSAPESPSPTAPRPAVRVAKFFSFPEPSPPRVWTPPTQTYAPVDVAVFDAYAPIASWRAISWREQNLIEGWNRSSEKARGLASFGEWLDAQGEIENVDVPRLKAKLFREAS